MIEKLKKAVNRVYPARHMAFYLQRSVMNPSRRKKIANLVAGALPKADRHPLSPQQESVRSKLDQEGYAELPSLLSATQIAEILKFLDGKKCRDRWRPKSGDFLVKEAHADCHVADYEPSVIMECPHLFEIANNPSVLSIVEQALGCRPTISSMNLWWSLSGHSNPEDAELYHRDVDEWHFIKLFVYLTDVTSESGPHKFMRGSHNDPKLLRIRRYSDEEVFQAFGADRQITFTGRAGTCFLENTFGFHKGQMPVTGNRLVYFAQYSLLPIMVNKYQPSPQLEKNASFDRYINRLYSKPR